MIKDFLEFKQDTQTILQNLHERLSAIEEQMKGDNSDDNTEEV
jgi:hypothetical protein